MLVKWACSVKKLGYMYFPQRENEKLKNMTLNEENPIFFYFSHISNSVVDEPISFLTGSQKKKINK